MWLGLKDRSADKSVDTLQDLCGVGYYELSDQESSSLDYRAVSISELLDGLSYSSSYATAVISAAANLEIDKARRIVVQYDFAYDPGKVCRKIEDDPVFLGVFPYFANC